MAFTSPITPHTAATMTRPHWGGAGSTVDQHMELYTGIVDTQFMYQNIFKSLSTQKSTAERSNQVRIDRLGNSQIKSRKAGEDVIAQRVLSDKMNITVEAMLYIRNHIDYVDDWTAPDYWTEMGKNNGTEFALEYDEAHIIRLQKARTWVAPAHLKTNGAFYDGLSVAVTLAAPSVGGVALTSAELSQNADTLVNAHSTLINEMIRRRVPMQDLITLVDPITYSDLLHSNKLLNQDFSTGNGDFAGRRVVKINGVTIVETTAFPTAVNASHHLSTTGNGNAFNVDATDLKCTMIVFSKSQSLVTVTAREWEQDLWDDKEHKSYVLDNQTMFTVDVRRPDTVGVAVITRTPKV